MTGRWSEFGGGRRREYREYDDVEDHRREVKEHIDEAEREQSYECREKQEHSETDEEQERYWREQTEDCIREALQILECEKEAEKRAREESDETEFKEPGNFEENDLDTERSIKEDLGHDMDEVCDDLHDRFVNDMERQLERASTKDSEVDETDSEGSSSKMTESSESYHDAGGGMAYATRIGSGCSEGEVAEAEEEKQEVSESKFQEPAEQQVESQESEEPVHEKGTNEITRYESKEAETVVSSGSQETYEYNDARASPEVSESEETAQEVSEEYSATEPTVSARVSNDVGELSETSESDENTNNLEQEIDEIIVKPERELVSHEVSEVDEGVEGEPEQDMSEGRHEIQASGDESREEEVTEGSEVETNEIQETIEEELLPETLVEYVDRVRELLDEYNEEDDQYDYVQDPLTGEIQRVPRILGEYETDEQRQRRKNRNLFAELSGEERERFKQLVRERAENDDERTAAAVERAWNQVIERAEREHNELRERVGQVLENPEVEQLLESMSKEDEESRTSVEHANVDDEVDEEGSLGQFLPRSYDEFIETLQRLSTLKKRKNVEREIEHVRIYYESKEELQRTDFSNLSKRQLWKYLSQKYGISDNTLRNWFAIGNLPRLLRIVRDEQAKAAGFNLHKPYAPITISIPESYDAFLEMLERHPYLRNVKGFNRMLRDVQEYYRLRKMAQRLPGSSYSELSRQVNVPVNTARPWIPGRTKPELLRRLLKNERLRRKMESDLKAALSMMVDPSTVYNTLQPLRAKKNQTLQQIADALLKLISDRNPITIIRLKPYNSRHGPRWLLDIAKKIQRNREKLERILDERHNKPGEEREIRLGLVHNTLYIWNRNTSPWDYLNLFSKELFFFKKRFQSRLIQKTRSHLGMKGNYNLSELIRQLTGYDNEVEGRIVPNLRPESSNLRGSVLQLVLQIQNKTTKEIEDSIEKIGIGRQITNPRILNEKELKELLARLFAIISSDGSIEPEHRISYYEKNKARQTRVKKLLQSFGEVAIHPLGDGFTNGFRAPNIIGRILSKVGVPVGDKVLQGIRLPDFILNGSPEVQLAYLQELIPEEGWVLVTPKDNLGLAWSRSVILYDANKSNQYKTEQKLTKDLVEFIERKGTKKERTYDSGVHEVYFILNMSDLKELMKSSNPEVSAKAEELDMVVRRFSSSHIEDERHIASLNGIMTSEQTPGEIRRSLSSDRVSAKWQVRTANERDAILWGIIAPPNDRKKKKRVADWIRQHPAKVKKVQDRLLHSQREILRFSEKKD